MKKEGIPWPPQEYFKEETVISFEDEIEIIVAINVATPTEIGIIVVGDMAKQAAAIFSNSDHQI